VAEAVLFLLEQLGGGEAAFRLHREGAIHEALTVHYRIGGTAVNGQDYKFIESSATLPAGQRGVLILVEPIDDKIPEPIETVLLELRPSDSGADPAPYRIGRPHAAAAIIVDNDMDRPPCRRLSDGMFHVCLPAENGAVYRLEASDNFYEWDEVCISIVIDGAIHFVDPEAPLHTRRYYRATPAPVTALDE
jgi:hypothetical protein